MNMTYTEHPYYNPDRLLDTIKEFLGLRYDASLARHLRVSPSTISKIRHRTCPVTADLLLSMHEETSLLIRDLRFLAGDFRCHTGSSARTLTAEQAQCQLSSPARTCAEAAGKRFKVGASHASQNNQARRGNMAGSP
ncbi:hypothetical protein [Duganella violaceipulchra]|uniref:Transcriptional regulator with XRE-family HTH domain n=1 Tax=Duganella violaceipulchra TaxID=2849652 RepID=A0AA41H8C3_9BURK|nr:hypothetical protein [Duganella violaceicalia]MBV6322469.1 hypothetical protein [Duganella violaceicalia]MCP2010674.1 transcriptional regulator with XRE-family HTH domain [Duganella violaceicalia]